MSNLSYNCNNQCKIDLINILYSETLRIELKDYDEVKQKYIMMKEQEEKRYEFESYGY